MAISKSTHFGIARKIVSNMTAQSWEEIPHAGLIYEPEVTAFLAECKKLNEGCTDKSKKITINTVMMKVICEGLKVAPKMNAHLEFNRKLVRGCLHEFVHVDVSMPALLPNGEMMTSAIHDSLRRASNTDLNEVMYEVSLDNTLQGLKQGKVLQAIRRLYGSKTGKHKVKTLSGQAKKDYYSIPTSERLTKHDIEQGTITISNLGSIKRDFRGSCTLLEIIPPQVVAIAINSSQQKPIVVDGEIKVGTVMPLSICMDHRALDYGDIVPFFNKLDEIFAHPEIIQTWK